VKALKLADLSVEWAALRELFHQAQLAHREAIESRAQLVKDIAQSREVMARADLLLTLPFVK
jgi:hypothetical protein